MPIRPLVLIALALVSWPALGATYYVRVEGDDTADGVTPKTAFKTVLRAAQVRQVRQVGRTRAGIGGNCASFCAA